MEIGRVKRALVDVINNANLPVDVLIMILDNCKGELLAIKISNLINVIASKDNEILNLKDQLAKRPTLDDVKEIIVGG